MCPLFPHVKVLLTFIIGHVDVHVLVHYVLCCKYEHQALL